MKLAQRAQNIAPSITLATAAKAKALQESGREVLNLTVGEPDFITPENIRTAAVAAIQNGKASFYQPSAGLPALRKAIIERTKADYGVTYELDQVVVTDGAKYALYALFQTILNPNDEVLIPVPYWVSYAEQVRLAEGKPVFVTTDHGQHYKVTIEQLEAARTAKTKAILLNSPNNPTGMIYSEQELLAIGQWALEHDILIIADDIYAKLVYNGNQFTPLIALSEELKNQTIVINGVSKSYAMTGWRIGYALGNAEIIGAMIRIISQSTSNCAAVSQYAALEALTGEQKTVEEMRQAFEQRLNAIYPKVAALPGFKLDKPQGAFYLFPDISETLAACGYKEATAWVNDLLEAKGVALVTGAGFGAPKNIRLSYATNLETLEKAVTLVAEFIEEKRKK